MKQNEPVRILLVEDDVDHAELVLSALQDNHVDNQVVHVTDGEAAMDYLLRRGQFSDPALSPMPHLVLLDLRLPKIDGMEVLRQIKAEESRKRIPVVILTTSDAERDIAKAYDLNANSYLVKPISFKSFNKMIRELDFYWLVLNRRPL